MKKILLVGPFKNSELRIGQYLCPPIGIYRIKSYIEQNSKNKVDIIDLDIDGKSYFLDSIKNKDYDIIGFSLLQPTLKNDLILIHEAKEISPKSLLVAGGQGAAFNHEVLLKKTQLDVIVRGFGELTFLDIVSDKPLETIKGLYIKKDEKIVDTGNTNPYTSKLFREISLSFDFSKVPYERYWRFMENIYSEEHLRIMKNEDFLYTIRIMTSSHCPQKCSFCSSTNFLDDASQCQKRLFLDAKDIALMVKKAIENHPECRAVYFNDDDFLFDKARILELCKELGSIKGISYFCLSRIDHIDEGILSVLKSANFKFIIYGVESFSNKILSHMNKNILCNNPRELSKIVIKKTIDRGITPLMNIILFYPSSDIKDIIENIENCIDLVEYGARLTVYPYIEFYAGASMFKDEKFDYIKEKINLKDAIIELPNLVVPKQEKINILAYEAIRIRENIIKDTLKKYDWKGVIPHPLYGLSLFLAVYRILGIDESRIDQTIEKVMTQEARITQKMEVEL